LSERSVTRATFVIERTYPASQACTFAAWGDPTIKARWFAGPPHWESSGLELDFRIGGREQEAAGPPGGPAHNYEAIYHDIVPERRIVYSYAMYLDETRISVSLATIELEPEIDGTRLTVTEQGAFLDGHDTVDTRRQGSGHLLDARGELLGDRPADV
jgi:uncharacterized protein YndB with AHSA1/START domain